jgi:carbamoyltransferase
MAKSIYILGLNAYHPDSSACIIKDGSLIAAVEEERFRRIKHWSGFPKEAIAYCLRCAGIGVEDLDYIALNRDPRVNLGKRVFSCIFKMPALLFLRDRIRNLFKITNIKSILSREFLTRERNIKAKVINVEHHRAHLASAFFVSPFRDAAVVSLDGFGDFTSCMVASGKDNKIKIAYEINFPHSLGLFYTAFTQFLGFNNFGDEHRVMGLSAFGRPRFLKEMEDVLKIQGEGRFKLNLEYFSFHAQGISLEWDNCQPKLAIVFSQKLIDLFGPSRKEDEELTQYHCDIAASLQLTYEKAFFSILNHAYKQTQNSNLCLAGGCVLNSLANGKIFDCTPFKEAYIQPASSDAGGALGAAYYLYNQLLGGEKSFIMKDAYWGPGFGDLEIENVIEKNKRALSGCIIIKADNEDELCKRSAQLITEGKILGWFQGRMEWGARALGNRSILVDPRRKEMKSILNERIKKREWFRPFAPSVLEEKAGEYFQRDCPDHFMSKVCLIKIDKREVIPAVTHIDGTGRLQTVSEKENPLFYKLIKAFENLTGIPLLLNTSFNENEPIVCFPLEAIDCFLRTKMDALAVGRFIITR